jgi:hypothetical protein
MDTFFHTYMEIYAYMCIYILICSKNFVSFRFAEFFDEISPKQNEISAKFRYVYFGETIVWAGIGGGQQAMCLANRLQLISVRRGGGG